MAEWPEVRLEELCDRSRGITYGIVKVGDFVPGGVPVIRGGDIRNNRIVFNDEKRVTREVSDGFSRTILRGGELLINLIAEPGHTAIVPPAMAGFNVSRDVAVIPLGDHVNHSYVNWHLQSPAAVKWLTARLSGSVTQKINLSVLREIPVPLPERSWQDRIAAVLGSLDDKIEVNERVTATIDGLTSTLYRRAVQSGRGVRKLLFGELADVNQLTAKAEAGGMLRYVDIAAVGVGSYDWPEKISWNEAPGRARRKASYGDTIWSTVRPNRRSHALVLDADPELVFSTGLAILTPRRVGPALLYEITRTTDFQNYLENVAEGSAYPAVRAERFKQAPAVLPAPEVCEEFEKVAMELRFRAHQARVESRTLTTLRDTLLPQLMSGRLCVRDAEKIVEDAV